MAPNKITTAQRFQIAQNSIRKTQKRVKDIQEDISSGKRVRKGSDDPGSYSKILDLRRRIGDSNQFNRNITRSTVFANISDYTLQEIRQLVVQARGLALQEAGAPADSITRASTAVQVERIRASILSLANTQVAGRYIFSGTDISTAAYNSDGEYQGNQGKLKVNVGVGQSNDVNVVGSSFLSTDLDPDLYQVSAYNKGAETDTFTFTSGINDVINFDYDHAAGVNPQDISLVGGTDTFTFTTGVNDSIVFDGNTGGGGGNDTKSLITHGGLTSGAVVSATQVAAAIKATLEHVSAQGDGTFEVTYDSSAKKFSIKKDSGANPYTINWTGSTARNDLGFTADDNTANPGETLFSDTVLTPKEGLLTSGQAATAQQVEVAIKTALETADATAATYTVTYDSSNKKFTIKKDSGANFTLNWAAATSTAAATLGFASNDTNGAANQNLISDKALTPTSASVTDEFIIKTGTNDQLVIRDQQPVAGATTTITIAAGTSSGAALAAKAELAINNSIKIVTSSNNSITIKEARATETISVATGKKSGTALAAELTTAINASTTLEGATGAGGTGYAVAYDAATDKFTITGGTQSVSVGVGVASTDGALGTLMGFTEESQISSLSAVSDKALTGTSVTYDSATDQFSFTRSGDNATNFRVLSSGTNGNSTAASTFGFSADSLQAKLVTSSAAVAFNVLTGVNDKFSISVDSGTSAAITIASGSFTGEELATKIELAANNRIKQIPATNNTITILEDGGLRSQTFTIAAGTKSGVAIASELQGLINASTTLTGSSGANPAGSGYAVQYTAASDKFTITRGTPALSVGVDVTKNDLASLLGFTAVSPFDTAATSDKNITGLKVDYNTSFKDNFTFTSPKVDGNSSVALTPDTFTFATGVNDVINMDGDTSNGTTLATVSLITQGGLTNGVAASPTEVAAAIKKAMEAAAENGTDTYTVTFDSSAKKFTIKKDAGGDPFTVQWATGSTAAATLGYTNNDTGTLAGANLLSDTTLTPGTQTILGSLNLNGVSSVASKSTPLTDLNGGKGVAPGSISITNRGGDTFTVNLTGASDISSVIANIEAVVTGVKVTLGADGKRLILTDSSSPIFSNLIVKEVGSTTTAFDLGIDANIPGNITGRELDPKVTSQTAISSLRDGLGVQLGKVKIGNEEINLALGSRIVVDDILKAITGNTAAAAEASISGDGKHLKVVSTDKSSSALVTDVTGSSVKELGFQGANNLVGLLELFEEALLRNDGETINRTLDGFTATLDRISAQQTVMGEVTRQFERVTAQQEELILAFGEILSKEEDTDLTQAITEYSVFQTTLEAAFASTAQIIQLSLLDFLR